MAPWQRVGQTREQNGRQRRSRRCFDRDQRVAADADHRGAGAVRCVEDSEADLGSVPGLTIAPVLACMKPFVLTALGVTLFFGFAGPSSAQTVEAALLAGYRFNNDLFEAAMNRPVDLDGAPVVGGVVNVGMGGGLWFEALFTRQEAEVTLPLGPSGPSARARIVVD